MSGGLRSRKQERAQLVHSLRSAGSSWVEIAEALCVSYKINPRLALRYAHGWSQDKAAEEWNKRWPDEIKASKNFCHWEVWPGPTGHAPTINNLSKLAELYQCSVSDLLADLPNFRHLDSANSERPDTVQKQLILPHGRTLDPGAGTARQDDQDTTEASATLLLPQTTPLVLHTRRLQQITVIELVQVILMWTQRLDPSVNRRVLLTKLSSALALAAISPSLNILNPDEYEPVLRFLQQPDTFDLAALTYTERMIINLRRQDNRLGPHFALHSAIGHRQLAQQLAQAAPDALQPRAISAYAEATQFLGWLCLNMGDYPRAQHYYDEARSAAHDAQNVELVTYILCTMSQLATWQGKPQIGIDHAAAAAVRAKEANNPLAEAYAADVAVQAYVADNQPDKCRETLDQEYASLQAVRTDEPRAPWWYFYDESFYWRTEGECALKLHRPEAAMSALDKSLTLADRANLYNYTVRLLFRAEARIQQEEIAEASSIMSDVTRLTAGSASQRIVQRVGEVRGLLTPWARTKAVRELDERLAAYRLAAGSGNGRTKSTYSV